MSVTGCVLQFKQVEQGRFIGKVVGSLMLNKG
jgi:hypothetical protein